MLKIKNLACPKCGSENVETVSQTWAPHLADAGCRNCGEVWSFRIPGVSNSFRDQAALAMIQGVVQTQAYFDGEWNDDDLAAQAFQLADALVREREK